MQGHLVKRGKAGFYSIVLHTREKDPKTGRDRVKWIATGTNSLRAAERQLSAVLSRYNATGLVPPAPSSSERVSEYLPRWLKVKAHTLRASTVAGYRSAIEARLVPKLGAYRLVDLKAQMLEEFFASETATQRQAGRKGPVSSSYVSYEAHVLKSALKDAVRWELISSNPMLRVALPAVPRREPRYFTPEEAARFVAAALDSDYYALYVVALTTGMRIGEMAALQWEDVDLQAGLIYVRHSFNFKANPPAIGPTKNGRPRQIAIGVDVVQALRHHKVRQNKYRLDAGPEWRPLGLVFTNRTGGHIWREHLKRGDFDPICKKAGVPCIRLHDLRHTMATLMLMQGVHPKVVQERLGHASIQLTMDTYSSVVPGLQREAADSIERLLTIPPRWRRVR